ncbi:MAG: hypothetical protein WC528_03965 [Patescibacteria group bacterium]
MKKLVRPTEPTPFAKWMGVKKLGEYDGIKHTYVVVAQVPPEALNFFGTVHGGYLAGLFDDAFGMLAYFIYGVNSATTFDGNVKPLKMLRLSGGNSLVFETRFKEESDCVIQLEGSVKRGNIIMAEAVSFWLLRKNRGGK